jgi:hypothetical protein
LKLFGRQHPFYGFAITFHDHGLMRQSSLSFGFLLKKVVPRGLLAGELTFARSFYAFFGAA